ncbi:hypothetical protein EVAR_30025_1 [Eumeta japonica]|uniref:Uncharacterized protein n=1 Tax=Eumeta variegata TaxID=151549 RepID=A0A4C1VVH0_EUMVA|nr:hypothetical protein EVAR_30025_1 [Eumeta japonica]
MLSLSGAVQYNKIYRPRPHGSGSNSVPSPGPPRAPLALRRRSRFKSSDPGYISHKNRSIPVPSKPCFSFWATKKPPPFHNDGMTGLKYCTVVLVRGHYVSYLPLCSRNEPVFVATCAPLAMPETRECVVLGATNVFTTLHALDMKILHLDNKLFHLRNRSTNSLHRQLLIGNNGGPERFKFNIGSESELSAKPRPDQSPLHHPTVVIIRYPIPAEEAINSLGTPLRSSEWHLGWERAALHGVSWYHLLHPDCCKEAQTKHRLSEFQHFP